MKLLMIFCLIIAKNCWQIQHKSQSVKKLVPNLDKETDYTAHYMNLQLYLSLGIKLIKIHEMLQFKLSNWLKYVDFNTEKRKNAKNEFEKKIF